MNSEHAIEIAGLTKTYKASGRSPEKHALKGIDLAIKKGSIFGLLGPNGAGKSTIINIMAGLVMKSAGTVKIWDIDIDKDPRQSRAAIGVVPQEINFDPFFSPTHLLEIQAGLYGVPKAERRTEELLRLVGLETQSESYTRALSGGMRRRLMVAKAMVHNPPVLVLDEPTAGVDIELRRALWDNVRALNARGTTVLLTTHYLEEAEELCDTIAIINHGQIIAHAEKEALLAQIDQKEIVFRLDRAIEKMPDGLERFAVQKQGARSLMCRYSPGEAAVGEMIALIGQAGYGIADISTSESSLEDVFLQMTSGHAA
ncbi:MAG: ABC transporter ATP-binding protein [Rhodospirillales bacterium]|nr:ABC transporter ATP-binding protein [Rhodospirillales bacterium]MCB9996353.1 ABC transporter ATP-binding protein [Rhodospirillales bacterium]